MESFQFGLEGLSWYLENIGAYRPGGHHPVHLGDTVADRYRVIHKFGQGGFGIVWLCRDLKAQELTKYVALKILTAEASAKSCRELNQLKVIKEMDNVPEEVLRYICLPLESFTINGPNGYHICIVYPALGPKVSLGVFAAQPDLDKILRTACQKIVKTMEFLHQHDICHGDFTPANILHPLLGIDGLPESRIIEIIGEPQLNPVEKTPGGPYEKDSAPDYLVWPITWDGIDVRYIHEDPCVIDFGESFSLSQKPAYLGIPGPYRSPELMLEETIGTNVDLWALGCTIFEIRTGRKLFATFDNEDDDYLDTMVEVLGVLPEPWWSTTWKGRRNLYKDSPDSEGRAVWAMEGVVTTYDPHSHIHPSVAHGARSLNEKIAPGVWYMDLKKSIHQEISDKENRILAKFLGKLLAYEPEKRISASTALEDEWFQI